MSREEPCGSWRTALLCTLVGKGMTFVSFLLTIRRRYRCSGDFYLLVESFTDQEQVSDLYRTSSVFEYAYIVYGKYYTENT